MSLRGLVSKNETVWLNFIQTSILAGPSAPNYAGWSWLVGHRDKSVEGVLPYVEVFASSFGAHPDLPSDSGEFRGRLIISLHQSMEDDTADDLSLKASDIRELFLFTYIAQNFMNFPALTAPDPNYYLQDATIDDELPEVSDTGHFIEGFQVEVICRDDNGQGDGMH